MSTQREPGYYWIKFKPTSDYLLWPSEAEYMLEWGPGLFDGRFWMIVGDVYEHGTEDLELGPKIPTPEELLAIEARTWCDVCVGKGDPGTGKPCICGGSGQAQDAVSYLREELIKMTRKDSATNPDTPES